MHHTLVHILFSFPPSSWFICLFVTKRGRVYRCVSSFIYDSCTFVGRENHRGYAYTKGEKTFLLCLFFFFFFYAALICFVALITSCLCVEHAYILMLLCFIGCMFGWSFALLYDHCSHLYMTISCLIKLFICFTTSLLDRILLVTLCLSFYNLFYLEGLMCSVQMF